MTAIRMPQTSDQLRRIGDRAPVAVHILTAYIFVVPFGSAIRLPLVRPEALATMSSALGAASAASLIVMYLSYPHRRAQIPPIMYVWLAFLGWSALSFAWSVNPPATSSGTIVLASLILTSATIVIVRYTETDILRFESALIASGLVTGLIALAQLLTGTLATSGIGRSRFALIGDDPNITAAALLLPAAAACNWAIDRSHSDRLRLFGLASAASSIFGIIMTLSRGGLVALAVVLGLLFVRAFGLNKALFVGLLLVALVAIVDLPVEQRGGGSTGRSSIWGIAVLSCDDYCWFGSGWDTFPDVHEQYVLERPELGILELRYEPHNLWLGSLVELGFVATLVLAIIALAAVISSMFVPTRFGWTGAVGITAILVANLFVENIEFKYFWLAVAAATIAGATRLDLEPSERQSIRNARTTS